MAKPIKIPHEAANDRDINAPWGMNIAAYLLIVLAVLIPFIVVTVNGHLGMFFDGGYINKGSHLYLSIAFFGLMSWKNPWTHQVHKRLALAIICLLLSIVFGITSEQKIRSDSDAAQTSAKVQRLIEGDPIQVEPEADAKLAPRPKLLHERYSSEK